jgi:SAM-dependent methyltransferase
MAGSASRTIPPPPARGSTAEEQTWAETYAKTRYTKLPWYSPRPSEWLVKAVRQRWIRPPIRIVDIGCGAGTNALWLAQEGFRATEIDLAPGAIEAARARAHRRGATAAFEQASALSMPFRNSAFEAALDNGCFHTIPIPKRGRYAREVARVVRPGGSYLLTWIAREETREMGPPHRPSLREVTTVFESRFNFVRTEFFGRESPGAWKTQGPKGPSLARYSALLTRRRTPQPPPR